MKLLEYIDCKNNTEPCEWYMHRKCTEGCAYARDIMSLGCGAADIGSVQGLQKLVVPGEGLELK